MISLSLTSPFGFPIYILCTPAQALTRKKLGGHRDDCYKLHNYKFSGGGVESPNLPCIRACACTTHNTYILWGQILGGKLNTGMIWIMGKSVITIRLALIRP